MSIALGAGTALSAFGVATPAGATVDCGAGVTVDATEAAIREAITADETLICVNPGTIDMSTTGVDASAEPFEVLGADLTLIALGTVVLDGGDVALNAILSMGSASEDLTVDGFTFSNFNNSDLDNGYGVVNLEHSSGTVTVINSTFIDNVGYAMVGGSDWDTDSLFPEVVVDNSVFESNSVDLAIVSGKSDATITDSTFTDCYGQLDIVLSNGEAGSTHTEVSGNFFASNEVWSVINADGDTSLIYNNTFVENVNGGSVLFVGSEQDSVVAFNTFAHNASDVVSPNADVMISAETNVSLLGNIWVNGTAGSLTRDETDTTANYIDAGGNFSTTNESAFLDNPSSSSNVAESALDLGEAADNGGPTWTAALGADSVAIDAVRPSVASALLGFAFDVDQRGDDRVGDIDAGAFEFGELADTGVDATGIALTGGVLGAAGVALVARRRRKA